MNQGGATQEICLELPLADPLVRQGTRFAGLSSLELSSSLGGGQIRQRSILSRAKRASKRLLWHVDSAFFESYNASHHKHCPSANWLNMLDETGVIAMFKISGLPAKKLFISMSVLLLIPAASIAKGKPVVDQGEGPLGSHAGIIGDGCAHFRGTPPGSYPAADSGDRSTGDSENVSLIGRWANGACFAADVVDDIAYFGNGAYLEIVDWSDPDSPVALGRVLLPGPVRGVDVVGAYAYVADGEDGLRVIDVSEPLAAFEAGFFDTGGYAYGVAASGAYAYVADESAGLRVIDVSDPSALFESGFFDTGGDAYGVALSGAYAYVADESAGLRVIDVSDPAAPFEAGFFGTGGYAYGVAVSGAYAYVANAFTGLRVIDVSDPASPFEAGIFNTGGSAWGVAVSGAYAYVADLYAGLRVIDVSDPASPFEAGFFDTGGRAYGVAVSGAHAYVADQYAGLRVIDVSDPAVPFEAGFVDKGGDAYGVAVSGAYAYVADHSDGLRVIDISDPAAPFEAGYFDTGSSAFGVAVSGAYAYVADDYNGLRVIDVSDPAAPFEAGFFDTGDNARDVAVSGAYAYVVDWDDGLRVIDVSDPAAPSEAGFFGTEGRSYGVAVSGAYAYVADLYAGLRVIDVSDPAAPFEAGFFDTGGDAYDVAVSGAYAYVADYSDGLRVIDVSDPAAPFEAGFFDTGGSASGVAVSGTYAYVADHEDGLWILQNELCDGIPPVTPSELTSEHHPDGYNTVSWIANDESDFVYYRLYKGDIPDFPFDKPIYQGAETAYLHDGGTADTFYKLIAVDNCGYESDWRSAATPVLLSSFSLSPLNGGVNIRWELSADSDMGLFRLLRSDDVGNESEVAWEMVSPGLFKAVDSDPILSQGGPFNYTLLSQAAGESWMILRSEMINLDAVQPATQLHGAWPNPFNPHTTISFTLAEEGPVCVTVHDIAGRLITELFDGEIERGEHVTIWHGRNQAEQDVASGLYFVRMQAEGFSATKKLVLLR